ncbi:helix-turn-helix transcriptional regulator [Kitasatospora sp. NPDC096147]|uniref:helix-turn-helix transcriptional regulator n=1 Tax=Kitasatospora sp. NPDC096147 TaxID=3364093 RepID=UPI00381F9FF0
MTDRREPRSSWTFLTQHARVLLTVSRDPEVRLRDLAATCGLTERAVQSVVTDLETAGYLTRVRNGRRNHYDVIRHMSFRHPAEARHEIAGLLELFDDPGPDGLPSPVRLPLPPGGDRDEHHEPL